MNRSKLIIATVLTLILAGTAAWSYVNFFASPSYDPEVAQEYLRHFDVRCAAEHDAEVCRDIIGYDHRRCFVDHLESADNGSLVYDRGKYLDCMWGATEDLLSKQ